MEKKPENPLYNLILNIVLPTIILLKFSTPERLGAVKGLILALSIPLFYGIYGLIRNKKINVFSVIGLVSILLTGALGLLQLDPKWIRLKETAVPFIFGVIVLVSLKTPFPLVKKILLNDQVLNISKIDLLLKENGNKARFDKRITISTIMLAGSFFISSALNNILAKILLVSEPGSTAFNQELGKMTALSFPVIAVPSMCIIMLIFFYIIKSIKSLTGLKFSEALSENMKD